MQRAYFALTQKPSAKLLHAVIDQRWNDIISYTPLDQWQEALSTVLTYAAPDSLSELCSAMAERLQQNSSAALRCVF